MRLRSLLIATMLALASLSCGEASATGPEARAGGTWAIGRDCGVTWLGDETAKVQACLDSARIWGGSLNYEGRAISQSAPLRITASSNWIGQVRGIVIENAMGGITLTGDFPYLTPDTALTGYFLEIRKVHIIAPSRTNGGAVIPFERYSNTVVTDSWIFAPGDAWCIQGTSTNGASPYYNRFVGNYFGCGAGDIQFLATGPVGGGNTNLLQANRFTGGGTCLHLGRYVQNWTVGEGNSFESCGLAMKLEGTRLRIAGGQRIEHCTSGTCIELGPFSDGSIEPLYWSHYIGPRITAAVGLDLASWVLHAQPPNP